jgi:hypothetical protein
MEEQTNYDVVNFANISDNEFVGVYGGQERRFASHSVTQLPRFLAIHFAGHLATKVLMSQNKDWGNDSIDRKRVIGEILASPVPVTAIVEETKTAPAPKEFEELVETPSEVKVETPESGYVCDECKKEFKTEPALKAHNTRYHKTN